MAEALDTARRIVTPLIIRRTKSTVDPNTGEPLLRLPPKHVHVHRLQLSLAERDFYETLWTKVGCGAPGYLRCLSFHPAEKYG